MCYGINVQFRVSCTHLVKHIQSMLINRLLISQVNSLMSSSVLLFLQKIDEENEANLLSGPHRSTGQSPVDEGELPSFDALTDGDA